MILSSSCAGKRREAFEACFPTVVEQQFSLMLCLCPREAGHLLCSPCCRVFSLVSAFLFLSFVILQVNMYNSVWWVTENVWCFVI